MHSLKSLCFHMRILCGYCADTVRLLCGYCADTVSLCKHLYNHKSLESRGMNGQCDLAQLLAMLDHRITLKSAKDYHTLRNSTLPQLDRTNAFDSYCTHPSKPNLHPENLNQVFVLLHAPLPPNFNVESTYWFYLLFCCLRLYRLQHWNWGGRDEGKNLV